MEIEFQTERIEFKSDIQSEEKFNQSSLFDLHKIISIQNNVDCPRSLIVHVPASPTVPSFVKNRFKKKHTKCKTQSTLRQISILKVV